MMTTHKKKLTVFFTAILIAVVASLTVKTLPSAPLSEPVSVERLSASPVLSVTNWYIDPQNGTGCAADTNSCTSASCGASGIGPCLTFAQILNRYGTPSPILPYGQSVTVAFLSRQSVFTDPIIFTPFTSGGGQPILTCLANAASAGATFAAGTLAGGFGCSGCTPSQGGAQFTMATVPAYVVAQTLLNNTTRNSYAWVDSVTTGTAKLSQPVTAAYATSTAALPALLTTGLVENDWVANDTIAPLTPLGLYIKQWQSNGVGDLTDAGKPTASWVIGCNNLDVSGTGQSEVTTFNTAAATVWSLDVFQTRFNTGSSAGRGSTFYMIDSFATQLVTVTSGLVLSVASIMSSPNLISGELQFAGNTIIHGTTTPVRPASLLFISAFSDGAWNLDAAATAQCSVTPWSMWGTYAVALGPGAQWVNRSAGTMAGNCLATSGAITWFQGPAGGGNVFDASAGTWSTVIGLSPANIDTNGVLTNPNSGARFINEGR